MAVLSRELTNKLWLTGLVLATILIVAYHSGGSYDPSAFNQLDENIYNYSTDDPYIYRAPKPLPFTSYSTNLESNVTHQPSPFVPQTKSQSNSSEQTDDIISDKSHHDISETYSEVKNVVTAAVNQIVRWVSSCSKFPQFLVESGFSVSGCSGRLGNQLGLLSFALVIYLRFGIRLAIKDNQYSILSKVFDMGEACRDDGSTFCVKLNHNLCSVPLGSSGNVSVTDRDLIWKNGTDVYGQTPSDVYGKRVDLPDFPQFLNLMVKGSLYEFRRRVPIRKDVLTHAEALFDKMKTNHQCSNSNCTMVSVHLRLGDYTNIMKGHGWPAIATETDYLNNAFSHVIDKYQNPIFYILGEHPVETKEAVAKLKQSFPNTAIVLPGEYLQEMQVTDESLFIGIDFALLSMADVTIVTYGSFGDFGGLLYKDKHEILFPKGHPAHDETGLNSGVPRFHGIDYKKID